MRRKITFIILILCTVLFCAACAEDQKPRAGTTRTPKQSTPAPTAVPATPTPTETPVPTATPTPTEVPVTPTPPIDAGKYGYSVQEVLDYYVEVGMSSEFSNGNRIDYVRKWDRTVLVFVDGSPTAEDLNLMYRLFDALNEVDGFPGIRTCSDKDEATLIIRFLGTDKFYPYVMAAIGDPNSDGYSLIWFSDGIITRGEIGILTTLTQVNRNHVILEEIVQALGLQNDSYRYPDSLFYQGYNEPQWPTDMDWLVFRFLYRPEMIPLMKYEDVRNLAFKLIRE